MIKAILARIQQKHRTITFPNGVPKLPDRFRGRPVVDPKKCAADCRACAEVCPTDAIKCNAGRLKLDLGRCLFCGQCQRTCQKGAIQFTNEYRMAVRNREDLIISDAAMKLADALGVQIRRILGRSLKLRQVSAGGCNGCEADTNVLSTVVFDLGRFGIQFVASPRHADGLLITGPVPENMKLALKKTYDAVPDPRVVIAVGSCAIAGGPYINHPQVNNGADRIVPVDLYIPGCPPHPVTILDGLLRLLGRLNSK
jgi:Ni,Fe-hydrogenase III small subunit/formate hydrogenlyase subunit 6/NADH:ubiquinone oxidoreductase subunit I